MGVIASIGSYLLLYFLVFGMSATVDIAHLRRQLRNRNALLTGISLQFLILPFLGFAVVKLLRMSAPMGITLLVITSSPGGSYSNWWCSMFNADLALSVTMTAISTLLSVIMLPANLILYATNSYSSAVVKSLDWYSLFVSLVVVIGAISSGLICSAKYNSYQFNLTANKLGNLAGVALISYSVALSSSNHDAKVWNQPFYYYFGVALPAILGLGIATWMATKFQLAKPERVAVAVESCYQNTGIATSVAIAMFDGEDLAVAVGVPLFYGICEAVLLAIYCLTAWKLGWTKAPANENICVVISKSYEVQEAELEDPNAIEVVLGSPYSTEGKEGGGDLHDLIFSQTAEGYQIDDESLNSLSNPQDAPDESSPKRAYNNNDAEENDGDRHHYDDDNSGPPSDDDSNFKQTLRQHRRKYSALNARSPCTETDCPGVVSEQPSSAPSSIVIPPLDDEETPSSRKSSDSNVGRIGRAVTTIRARVQGYQKTSMVVEVLSSTSRESSSEDSEVHSVNDGPISTVESDEAPLSSFVPETLDEESPSTAVVRQKRPRLPVSGKSFD